jgi:hypothetical protein
MEKHAPAHSRGSDDRISVTSYYANFRSARAEVVDKGAVVGVCTASDERVALNSGANFRKKLAAESRRCCAGVDRAVVNVAAARHKLQS